MKISKKNLLLGAVLFAGIILTGCSNGNDNTSSSSSEEQTTTPAAPAAPTTPTAPEPDNIATMSIPSLVSRQVYMNAYHSGGYWVETERWYYGSTNTLTNYVVTTIKDIGTSGNYQEVRYVFSADPLFSKTGTGDSKMYDTSEFVAEYNPEAHGAYVGKYIYLYNSNNKCLGGAYVEKNATAGTTGGCFKAVYGPYGYLMFKEAASGTISGDIANGYTISPTDSAVTEFRLCAYNTTAQQYDKEAYYSGVPAGWTDLSGTDAENNTAVANFIASSTGTTPAANLITKYSCTYDSNNKPVLEVKYEKLDFSNAPDGTAGNYSAGINETDSESNNGNLTPDTEASNVRINKIVYEFDTVNTASSGSANFQISVQRSYQYTGTASIPDASGVATDGSNYSADGELSIISRQFDAYGRKTRETETSYGNKVKTIVRQYDAGTTDDSGLGIETTYNGNDLMVSRTNYNLLEHNQATENTDTASDSKRYETLNYEYNTTRGYAGDRGSVWGINMKRPETVHWCER